VAGISGVAIDITSRKEADAHLRLLMRELTHRSKNLLAVIQAMARQSALHSDVVDDFVEQFNARLQAMAASHDLLARESWHGVSLAELLTSQLGPYLPARSRRDRIVLNGPPVNLRPEAAQSLGLALHELAINAEEYGALSTSSGQIAVDWQLLDGVERDADGGGGGEGDLEIVWHEKGGPPVVSPTSRGFGSLVIERNLSRAVDAKVNWAFEPEGLRFSVKIPRSQLLASL
jgi:two-component sensor histidine kinase